MGRRRAPLVVTIDLDGSACYRAIHGVSDAVAPQSRNAPDRSDTSDTSDVILDDGVPRFLAMCERLDVRATLFVIGRDLQRPAFAARIAAAARAGHDVQSHSHAHDYALSRASRAVIDSDLHRSLDGIEAVTGRRPSGFRAPGYNVSDALLDGVVRAGLSWSSSVLPSTAYWAARALAVARLHARGRASASLVGDVRAFVGTGRPFLHDNGLRELPMTTAAGWPWIGTTLALAPDVVGAALTHTALRGADALGFAPILELHAADFVDGSALPDSQPDARVPLDVKLQRIEAAIVRGLHARGSTTLHARAASLAPRR